MMSNRAIYVSHAVTAMVGAICGAIWTREYIAQDRVTEVIMEPPQGRENKSFAPRLPSSLQAQPETIYIEVPAPGDTDEEAPPTAVPRCHCPDDEDWQRALSGFSDSEIDDQWAMDVRELMTALLSGFDGGAAVSPIVDCRTKVCRVSMPVIPLRILRTLKDQVRLLDYGLKTSVERTSDGGAEAIAYFYRGDPQ